MFCLFFYDAIMFIISPVEQTFFSNINHRPILHLLYIETRYSKNPFEIPEGTHRELAFRLDLQTDITTEQLYYSNIVFLLFLWSLWLSAYFSAEVPAFSNHCPWLLCQNRVG